MPIKNRNCMYKLLLPLLLVCLSANANKNWIALDSTNNSSSFTMKKPSSYSQRRNYRIKKPMSYRKAIAINKARNKSIIRIQRQAKLTPYIRNQK